LKNKKSIFSSLMLATLLVLGTTTIASSDPVEDEPIYVYLTWLSDPAHTINVNWRTDRNYVGEVHYDTESRGGAPGAYSLTTEGTGGVTTSKFEGYIHHVELTELEPDTTYYFICGNPDYGWSEELSFRTAPVERKNIRFVVGGDSRWETRYSYPEWPSSRDTISQLMASYNPDFVLFIGDYIWSGQEQNEPDTWDNWLGAMYKYWRTEDGRLIPMIPVIGNHEVTYPEPLEYDPMVDASNYYMLFVPPENRPHYSLNWGPDLHITVLDSEIVNPRSDSWGEQIDWLKQDLTDHYNYLWKLAADHKPPLDGTNFLNEWIPEFDTYHLDLVFSGHEHYYERSHPINLLQNQYSLSPESFEAPENGTIYVVSGGWGAPNYDSPPHWYSTRGPIKDYHFTVVDVYENGSLHLKAVNFNGEVIDGFAIQKDVQSQQENGGGVPVAMVAAIVIMLCAIIVFLYLRSIKGQSGQSNVSESMRD